MTDQEIDTAITSLVGAKPLEELFQRARELKEQQAQNSDAGALPDLTGGIAANWDGAKAWVLDGAAGPHDLHRITAAAKADLVADRKAAFIKALLVMFKTCLRCYPDIQ